MIKLIEKSRGYGQVIFGVLITLTLGLFLYTLTLLTISEPGVEVNANVLIRLTMYVAFIIALFILLTGKGFIDKYVKHKEEYYIALIIFVCCCLVLQTTGRIQLKTGFLISSGILAAFSYFLLLMLNLENRFIAYIATISLSIVVTVAPFLHDRYLNSESYWDKTGVNHIIMSEAPTLFTTKDYFKPKLSPNEKVIVYSNISELAVDRSSNLIGLTRNASDGFLLKRSSLARFCLYADYSKEIDKSNFRSVKECVESITSKYNAGAEQYAKQLNKIPFISWKLRDSAYTVFNETNLDNYQYPKRIGIDEQLNIYATRGGFFHHYQSIARSLYDGYDFLVAANNQYGVGPLFLVNAVHAMFNVPLFDSILFATITANTIVLILVGIYSFTSPSYRNSLLFAYATSILITFSLSDMMAPFLYYIRYLPIIIYIIYISYKSRVVDIVTNKSSLVALLYLIICFYNFEYAVIFYSSLFLSSIYLKSKKLGLVSVIGGLIALAIKYIASSSSISGNNYKSYLYGIGMSADFNLISLFFILTVIITAATLISNRDKLINHPSIVVVGVLYMLLSAKVVWNGSPNHIGPLVLILMILMIDLRSKVDMSGLAKTSVVTVTYFFVYLTFVFSLSHIGSFALNKKMLFDNYCINDISKIYNISCRYQSKIKEFKEVYKDGDLAISPMDNALSLSISKSITTPYADISTNINNYRDLSTIVKSYLEPSVQRIIVDREVLESGDIVSNLPIGLLYRIADYRKNIQWMSLLFDNIQFKFNNVCGKTANFVIFCRGD